jgi:hypothetical protein
MATTARLKQTSRDADGREYAEKVGELGVLLFLRSAHMARLRPQGCAVLNGHKPRRKFANLDRVQHLDIIVYDPPSMTISAICEVKTVTDPSRKTFGANGACAEVMERAKKAGIPISLAIVRLKHLAPTSIQAPGGLQAHVRHLQTHPEGYSIEFYPNDAFTVADGRFSIGRSGIQLGLPLD